MCTLGSKVLLLCRCTYSCLRCKSPLDYNRISYRKLGYNVSLSLDVVD